MTENLTFKSNNNPLPVGVRNSAYSSDADYEKIMDVVEGLWQGHVIKRGAGFCLSMSDLIHTVLKQQMNIDSTVTECKLTVLTNNPPSLKLIGHEGLIKYSDINNLDTHVVCITKTPTPYLIDLSISNVLPYVGFVVEPLVTSEPRELGSYTFGDSKWIYQERENPKLPEIYQSNMLQRWRTDQTIFSKLRLLKILIAIALTISTINAVRGLYDFYQVYVDDTNHWGPATLKDISQRLEKLEHTKK